MNIRSSHIVLMPALLSSALLSSLLAGCISMAGLHTTAKTTDANALQTSRTLADVTIGNQWIDKAWWKTYGDPQLDALIEEGLANSPSIQEAQDRVEKAIAAAQSAGATRMPTIDAKGNGDVGGMHALSGSDDSNGAITFAQAQLEFKYDLDLWGRHRAAYRAALDEVHATQVDQLGAQLLLSTSIARAYIQLQHAYDTLDVTQALLEQRQYFLELTRQRVEAGIDSDMALKQAEAAIPETQQQLVQINETIALTQNQIAALIGRGPDRGLDIQRPHLQMSATTSLPTRVPADLIGRRPDVVAQRMRMDVASQNITMAKADFYPDINLSAYAGINHISLADLLTSNSLFAVFGPAITLPIYSGGAARANLRGKDADYNIAVDQYNQTVIDALHDVVDQLTSLRSADQQRIALDQAITTAKETQALAQTRFNAGIDNYLSVITAQEQLLTQDSLDVDLRAHALDLSINLIRSLGGGLYLPNSAPDAINSSTNTTNTADVAH